MRGRHFTNVTTALGTSNRKTLLLVVFWLGLFVRFVVGSFVSLCLVNLYFEMFCECCVLSVIAMGFSDRGEGAYNGGYEM